MLDSVRDDSGAQLDYVTMALGWDPVRQARWFKSRRKDIDLNAAALLFAGTQITDVVYHEQLASRDGSVRHLGDSTTGEGKGDDEVITVDLTRLPADVTTVIFLVTCYTGQTFQHIENAFCRLVDGRSNTEIARYDLSGGGAHTGWVMGKVSRSHRGWQFQSIGAAIQSQHPVEAVPQLTTFLT